MIWESDEAVLLVSEALVPSGLGLYTAALTEGLSAAQVDHFILTDVPPIPGVLPPAQRARLRVRSHAFQTLWWPFLARKLVAWADERQIGLIHGLSTKTAGFCSRLAARLGVPYVLTVHHYLKRGALYLDPLCRGVITVSEDLREHLVNDAGLSKDLIHLVPAGIQVPVAPPERPSAYLSGGTASVPLVSSFGRLVGRKDLATFLRAARKILDGWGRECSFIVAGDGPEESALRKLTKNLGIERQVTFCHGAVRYDELLRDTDVYVQTSITEGFGSMVLQAMAYGVPVVATTVGGFLSLVEEGETGFLVPARDADALAERVLQLLKDPDLAIRFGDRGRAVAAEHYKLETMISRTLELYQRALLAPAAS